MLEAPKNLAAEGGDGSCAARWEAVNGAAGYKLYYYSAQQPEKCIKTRYSQTPSKTVPGFKNGKKYLVQVCAFTYKKDREVFGKRSEKAEFTPVCSRLKAQKVICIGVGQTAQILCEYNNSTPWIDRYVSDNEKIATVDALGVVTAHRKGSCRVKITADDGSEFTTRIEVDRSYSHGEHKAVIMLAGDIMCALAHQRAVKSRSFDFTASFAHIKETLSEADCAVGVLETTCFDGAPYESEQLRLENGYPNCNSPSSFIAACASAGFRGLVTACDHNFDRGLEGLRATADEIKRLGMRNIGTLGGNAAVLTIKGIKVGFVALSLISGAETRSSEKVTKSLLRKTGRYSEAEFSRQIASAREKGAEYIIAFAHWGTMNSSVVSNSQKQAAEFMANAGADLIVGSHPHVVQRFSIIKAADGREVPCAYSLGNFLSAMNELRENSDGAMLRLKLTKKEGKISCEYSCIPVYSASEEDGFSVTRCFPPYSEPSRDSFSRTMRSLGNKLRTHTAPKKVMLSGSAFLKKIFAAAEDFTVDTVPMHISQISLGSATVAPDEGENYSDKRLMLELQKDLAGYIKMTKPDLIAVDFFAAGEYPCRRTGDEDHYSYFTNIKSFVKSVYYTNRADDFIKLRPPYGEMIWKPAVRNYAAKLLDAADGDRIILFRSSITGFAAAEAQLRTTPPPVRRNKFIRQMEDYFIELVNPLVVDLSEKYFILDNGGTEFEQEYYSDALRAAREVTCGDGVSCVSEPDSRIWFERVLKYYDSMTMRSYHKRLLDLTNAADLIIARTSREFVSNNRERILKLKRSGRPELSSVREFFRGDSPAHDLVRAAEIIETVDKGNLEKPYDFYKPAFTGKYNIVKTIARLLAERHNAPVDENNAEIFFLLRGKPVMKRYLSELYMMTVDIWGSSVSREALNHCPDAHGGHYISHQPAILNYENRVGIDVPDSAELFRGSEYRRRLTIDSFEKTGVKTLDQSSASWILLDFCDLIGKCADYHGYIFPLDDFLASTEFYKQIRKYCSEGYLFEKKDMDFCFDRITKFAEEIADIYGDNIILLKSEPKNCYITFDYKLKMLEKDRLYDIKKKFIALCEERFASVTGCFVIDISKNFFSSEEFPFGGKGIMNYEEEFYRAAGAYISEILNGNEKKLYTDVDVNYILLRNLKLARWQAEKK